MRTPACLLALLIVLTSPVTSAGDSDETQAGADVIRLSEPVEATDSYEVFGAPMEESGRALRLAELVSDSDHYLDSEVVVKTRIAKVCQKKGCFFVAQEGDAVARVTFQDYGFFIPTDAGGKEVTLAGVFTRRELTESRAQHYQDDLGETRSEAPLNTVEYQIVATSVRIPRS